MRVRKETLERCAHGNQAFRCSKCGYVRPLCYHGKQRAKCSKCKKDARTATPPSAVVPDTPATLEQLQKEADSFLNLDN